MSANIKVKAASEYIGLSVSTLNKMRCFGGGPRYIKLGRSVFYTISELDVWTERHKRDATWAGANDNRGSL